MTNDQTLERRRQREAEQAIEHRHRSVFGTEHPADEPAPTSPPPPTSGRGPGYNLRVRHLAHCAEPKVETVGWFDQLTRQRVLNVTRCLNCAAETSQRIGP